MSQVTIEQLRSADDPLPPSWIWDRIGNYVAGFVGGCSPTKRDYAATGFLVLNKGNIKPYGAITFKEERKYVPKSYADQFADRYITHSDLVVTLRDLSQKADFLGLIGIYRESEAALLTQGAYLIRLKPGIENRYLVYYSNSPAYRSLAKKGKHGSTQVHLRNGDFLGFSIPIAPPEEQKRIVAEIEKQFTRLEVGVAALRRVQANLKRYRAAVLKAACEGRLVPTEAELHRQRKSKCAKLETGAELLTRILAERRKNWIGRGQYKEPAAVGSSGYEPKGLPEGWAWASVEQLSARVQYGSSAKTNEDATGVPVLRMGNIQEGKFDFDKLKYLPKSHNEFPELLLAEGDLLFNRTNSAELVGKTAVFRGTPELCSFASYLIRVRFCDGCLPDLVAYFINSVFGRAWIAGCVSQQVGQANVNGSKLQALTIPLPPLAEQTRIVAEVERRLSVVEELESVVTDNLQRATRLRQSILQKAFTGNLTNL